MACSLKTGAFYISGFEEISLSSKSKRVSGFCPSFCFPQPRESYSRLFPVLSVDFFGKPLLVSDQKGSRDWRVKTSSNISVRVCESFPFSQFLKKFQFFFHLYYWGFSSKLMYVQNSDFSGTSINLCKQGYEMVGKDL